MDQTGTYLINMWKATGSHVERIGGYRKSHEAISMGRAKGGRYWEFSSNEYTRPSIGQYWLLYDYFILLDIIYRRLKK